MQLWVTVQWVQGCAAHRRGRLCTVLHGCAAALLMVGWRDYGCWGGKRLKVFMRNARREKVGRSWLVDCVLHWLLIKRRNVWRTDGMMWHSTVHSQGLHFLQHAYVCTRHAWCPVCVHEIPNMVMPCPAPTDYLLAHHQSQCHQRCPAQGRDGSQAKEQFYIEHNHSQPWQEGDHWNYRPNSPSPVGCYSRMWDMSN